MGNGDVVRQNSIGEDSTSAIASPTLRPRPNLVRRETDQILSYYESEHAGRCFYDDTVLDTHLPMLSFQRDISLRSNSPSEYSGSEPDPDQDLEVEEHIQLKQQAPPSTFSRTRRPSVPSEGGSDRRRLAIVEMDSATSLSLAKREGQSENQYNYPSGLLSRRGLHMNGLALVAPPDASPKTYTDLTPPPSAPIVAGRVFEHSQASGHQRSASEATHVNHRTRLHHKTSRDIGIVGTGGIYSISEGMPSADNSHNEYDGLQVPIFQTPAKSRSPSPSVRTPDLSDSATTSFNDSSFHPTPATASTSMRTPEIGEGKDVVQPVVGPVIVGLNSDGVVRRQPSNQAIQISPSLSSPRHDVSPYVHYQPGVHSTAGPLPPPPRLVFHNDDVSTSSPPPRPPRLRTPFSPQAESRNPRRDIEALKESLQLPESVSAVLASRSNSRVAHVRSDSQYSETSNYSDDNENNSTNDGHHRTKRNRSIHRREGAFPPSSSSGAPTVELTSSQSPPESAHHSHPHDKDAGSSVPASETVRLHVERATLPDGNAIETRPELHRESSWISIGHEVPRVASPDTGSESPTRRSVSRSPSIVSSVPPLPPMKYDAEQNSSGEHILSKAGITLKTTFTNLKRFSALPRTPSMASLSVSSSTKLSRTPSPSVHPPATRRSPRPKIRNRYPAALECQDIVGKKNASERVRLYADKINDLARHDCGLGDWVVAMKMRGTGSRAALAFSQGPGDGPLLPSSVVAGMVPRHVSHGSITSQATFPVRPDAYTATALSVKPSEDIISARSPPPLPYPSLALSPRAPNRTSTLFSPSSGLSPRTYQVPLATGPKNTAAGFFASIGRKASVKRDKGFGMTPSSPTKVLSKRPPSLKANISPPRPTIAPSVPGGPRAAPSKVQRAQTLSVAPKSSVSDSEPISRRNTHRTSAMNRRPSLFSKSASSPSQSSNSEFEKQVDRLADLLPQADRHILAAYLRRTGQDMLAIGQYLEDEKNGTLRYD